MGLFEDQPISVLPRNSSTLKGLFNMLKEVNGEYGSRYNITGQGRLSDTVDCIDKMNHTGRYWSINDYYNISFSFDSPLFVTHYSIMNASPQNDNSYPKAWDLFGLDDSGRRHLIDSRAEQNFGDRKYEVVKTFSTRARKAYRKILWVQNVNSDGNNWVTLKHMDFFGILCGKTGDCKIPLFFGTCHAKYYHSFSISHSFVMLVYYVC